MDDVDVASEVEALDTDEQGMEARITAHEQVLEQNKADLEAAIAKLQADQNHPTAVLQSLKTIHARIVAFQQDNPPAPAPAPPNDAPPPASSTPTV